MKNSSINLGIAILTILSLDAFQFPLSNPKSIQISFTIKNDLNKSITLYIGKGTTILDEGTAYKFTKDEGDKIYLADKGSKGKLLIIIKTAHEGKIFLLSEWIEK